MEQAHEPALAHHVDRIARLGSRVLINETRYYITPIELNVHFPYGLSGIRSKLSAGQRGEVGGSLRLFWQPQHPRAFNEFSGERPSHAELGEDTDPETRFELKPAPDQTGRFLRLSRKRQRDGMHERK